MALVRSIHCPRKYPPKGLLDNTIVVFTSDHGDNLGEHGSFFKGSMLEGSVGVPLLVYWPGHMVTGGQTIDDNVSHIDLVPTLLQAAGISPPEHMPGKNMLPLMAGKESWEDHPVWSEGISETPNRTSSC
jgi:arylsulfatase A-like enzyme